MNIADKHVVSIHYTLTDDDGETLDSSADSEPLFYLQGSRNIIPGLEKALAGKSVGEQLQVTIEPEDGYGAHDDDLIQLVPLDAFEDIDEIEAGMQFEARSPEGESQLVVVEEVKEDGVVINANHPLAGLILHFDVTVEDIREATAEEIAHGHAHIPGHSH